MGATKLLRCKARNSARWPVFEMEAFYLLLVLITPSGVTYELMEMDYPTYSDCVNAGKAEAVYRSNRTRKVSVETERGCLDWIVLEVTWLVDSA
jgi:hypothetical protein